MLNPIFKGNVQGRNIQGSANLQIQNCLVSYRNPKHDIVNSTEMINVEYRSYLLNIKKTPHYSYYNSSSQGSCEVSVVNICHKNQCHDETHLHYVYTDVLAHPPGQNGHHFTEDIYRCIFVNQKYFFCILIEISLKFVPKGPTDNNPAWFR